MEIDLNGLMVTDDGSNAFLQFQRELIIPANGFLVFGINADSATNGGVAVDYEYIDMTC